MNRQKLSSIFTNHIVIGIGFGLISALIRLYRVDYQSLRYDETFTVFIARLEFLRGIEFMVGDAVHPPLYYWIQKLFLVIGDSEALVRLPAVLFGSLGVMATYLLVENWINRPTALIAACLMALSPFHIWFSQDARMYTLLALLSLVCMGAYLKFLSRTSRWNNTVFVFASMLAYLTHYFALFSPLVQFIHLTINIRRYPEKIRLWTGLQFVAALPMIGWIYLLSRREVQHFGIGWIPEPRLVDLANTLLNFTVGYFEPIHAAHWGFAALCLLIVIWGIRVQGENNDIRQILVLWVFLPPLLIFLFSFRRPTYVDRFFILSLPPFLILLSAGVTAMKRRWLWILFGVMVVVLAVRSMQMLHLPIHLQKEDYRQVSEFLRDHVGDNELVVVRRLQMMIPFLYYQLDDIELKPMEINRDIFDLNEMSRGYDAVWLFYRNLEQDVSALGTRREFTTETEKDLIASSWINGYGPRLIEKISLQGVEIFRFDLKGLP
jgi:mannosyltransferase